MDLATYLQQKEKRKEQEKRLDSSYRKTCFRCFRPQKSCYCSFIQPFETNTRFVILMHTREARKQRTGTGRLAHLCLKNSQIIEGTHFTENSIVNKLVKDGSYFPAVLYPGESSLDVSTEKVPTSWTKNRKLLVFVVDGTWIAAKKMMRLSRNLHKLPRISVNPKEKSQFIIKQQPTDFCLSTIESLYYLINDLEKHGIENCQGRQQGLLDIQKRMCEYQLGIAADPSRGGYRRGRFRPPEERVPSAKWQKRSIFYK